MTDDIIPLEEARRHKAAQEISVTPETAVDENDADKGRPSQRDKLIACASAADLWHDADGTGYATLAVGEHVEHYLLRSKGFRLWLGYRFYKAYKGAPGALTLKANRQ